MPDNEKTRDQLQQEIDKLRTQLIDLHVEQIKRKQAEDELWESERRFLRLLDSLPSAVFVLDGQGKPYYQNKVSRELMGRDIVPEAGGRLQATYPAFLAGTDKPYPKERSPILRALAGESTTVDDMEIRGAGGPDRTVRLQVSGSPIFDAQGNVKYAVAVFDDISERKRAQEALKHSEAFNRAVIELSPVGITVRRRTGELVLYNQAWKQIWSLTEEEIRENERRHAGKSFEERYHHLQQWSPDATRLFESGGELFIPEVATQSDKPEAARWVSVHFYTLQNERGEVEQVVTLTQDITERKRAEEALRQSGQRLKEAQEMGRIGNWEYDLQSQTLVWSDQTFDLYERDRASGPPSLEEEAAYYSPEQSRILQEYASRAIETGQSFHYDLQPSLPSGRAVFFSATMRPLKDESGRVVKLIGTVQDITESRRAEETLRRERNLVARLIETSPAGITVVNRDGQITFANARAEHVLGLKKDEITQRTYNAPAWRITDYDGDPFPDEDLPFRRVMANGQSVHDVRHAIEWPDGQRVLLSINASPLFDESGKVDGMVANVEDITERKEAEDALRQSEERYRTLVENVNIGVYRTTGGPRGRFVQANPALAKMLGFDSVTELMSRPVSESYLLPEERERFLAKIRAQGFVRNEPLRLKRKDETPLWASATAQAQLDPGGAIVWIDGVIEDITERKRAEEALKESEEKFRLAFENAQDAIFWADPETGLVTKCNKAATILLEKKREEIEGCHQTTLHPPQKAEQYANMFTKHIEHKGWVDDEAEVITQSGQIKPVHITASITALGGKPILQGIFRDITERKQAVEALKQSERFLSDFFSSIQDGVAVVDKDYTILKVNPTMEEWYMHALPLVGKKCYAAYHSGSKPCEVCPTRHTLQTGESAYEVVPKRGLGGQIVGWLDLYAFPLIDAATGKMTGVIEYVRDISDRRQAEEELKVSFEKLMRMSETAIQAMAKIVEMKDPYTAGHQRNVARLAYAIARELGLSKSQHDGLRVAALIHDVGKIYIPSEILTRPGPLSEVEVRMIKTHPQLGYDILKTIEFPWPVAEIVWQHHEKANGSGYPRGLKSDRILVEAKILAVADVVESLAFHRPYRPGKGIDQALEEIARQRGELYDEGVVDACLRLFAEKRFAFE